MRIIISLFIFLGNFFNLSAQFSTTDYDDALLTTFYTTKTFAVLTGNAELDEVLKKQLTENWKHTPIDFMSETEFKLNLGNKNYSFISFIKITEPLPLSSAGPTSQGPSGMSYRTTNPCFYLALINGGKKYLRKYKFKDLIVHCPLDHFNGEQTILGCKYRLPLLLQNINSVLSLIKEKHLKTIGSLFKKTVLESLIELYNSKRSLVTTKKLLVLSQNVKLTEEEFKSVYPYEVEYCTKEELEKAINEKNQAYLAFIPIYSNRCDILIYDLETYDCIFTSYDNFGNYIRKGDIRRMTDDLKTKE